MALWKISVTRAGTYQLVYRNRFNDKTFVCGETRGDTPVHLMVDWIVNHGDPKPGDLIVCPDETVLQLSSSPAQA